MATKNDKRTAPVRAGSRAKTGRAAPSTAARAASTGSRVRAKAAGSASPSSKAPPRKRSQPARRKSAAPRGAAAATAPAAAAIVGVGASAGGLEALRALVSHLPPQAGLTYVIAQHLSPTHHSMLVTLLARETRLPVAEVTNGLTPQANVIYVTPARTNVTVENGRLRLTEATRRTSPKPSVDEFFLSLAEDQGENAIGVVLSGTGTDGARGIRAIRAAGGATFVQDQDSARYGGMPHAAEETGCVDYVLPPEQIADRLARVAQLAVVEHDAMPAETRTVTAFERVCSLVRGRTGIDFHVYKDNTLRRRMRRRMAATRQDSLEDYEAYLRENAAEVENLAREVLISVTSLFRDRDAFTALAKAVDELVSTRRESEEIRVWVPGCATGEEAYSLAILLAEAGDKAGRHHRVQIFATDIDAHALARARRGLFPATEGAGVPPLLLTKYFTQSGDELQISKRIREMMVFSAQDLSRDPPFLRLDLVSCRNVLIYFRPQAQQRVLETFYHALNPGGLLFLGRSETPHHEAKLFAALQEKARIYRRMEGVLERSLPSVRVTPLRRQQAEKTAAPERAPLSERVLAAIQGRLLPPSVLVDERLDLQHVFGDVSPFVRIASGTANLNLATLVIHELRVDVRSMVLKAQREPDKPVVHMVHPNALPAPLRIGVLTVPAPSGPAPWFLVTFDAAPERAAAVPGQGTQLEDRDAQIVALEEQLTATREHLHTVIEELETSNEELQSVNEELQSVNEELQSANEELQSANEELETANEELQSSNEELTTVNEELEAKTHELIALYNDLQNVKDSLAYPLIVLDEHQRVMLYNPPATQVFGLTPGAVGQLLFSLPCHIDVGDLRSSIEGVIQRGERHEQQVDGPRCWLISVRPYVDEAERRRGAVLVFVDNTDVKHAEQRLLEVNARLQDSHRFTRSIIDSLEDHICVIDESGTIIAVNESWRNFAAANGGASGMMGVGSNYVRACQPASAAGDACATDFLAGLRAVMDGRAEQFSMEYPCHSPDQHRWFMVRVTPFHGEGPRHLVIVHEDVTARKRSEKALRLQSRALDASLNGIVIADARMPDMPLVYVNRAFEETTGYSAAEALGRNCRFLQGEDLEQPGLQQIRRVLEDGTPGRALLRNYRKDGTLFWNELSLYPVTDDEGRAAYFVGIQRDMSAVVASESALKASLEREKLALTFADVGTFEWDIRANRIVSSDIALHLLGLSGTAHEMDFTAMRSAVHEDDRPLFDDAIKVCLAGHGNLDLEYRVRWPDGTIHWLHTKGDVQTDAEGIARRMLCLSQDITQRRETDERVRFIAHHDALTGLPNRTLLRDRLQQAINGGRRHKSRVAVLFIDLDHFKTVNDSLGHQIGDQLLQGVANRLRTCTRDTDTLCRQSGDEYIVVLPGVRDSGEAAHVATKIVETLSAPYHIEGHELTVTPSIGISIYPEDGDSIDVLVRNADAAMYHAKGSGRSNFQFFTPEMNARATERLAIATQLRRALSRAELRVYYQPQYDVNSGQLVGAEALVRWLHPERGLLLPETFIPVAEESDLLIEMGKWVLQEACLQNRRWQDQGLRSIPVAVNFSPLQFRRMNVIETVSRALHDSGLTAECLEIELTERAFMSDADESAATLRDLHKLGIRLAVDDFGTGYSSLSYLMRFPIDKLKIDRSFVLALPTDVGAAAIVRAVINLGHSLNLDIVAEGVETEHQLDFLRKAHCSTFQGFLAQPALSPEQFGQLLTVQ
jgi:two-component system CheB/CheR fusion protein